MPLIYHYKIIIHTPDNKRNHNHAFWWNDSFGYINLQILKAEFSLRLSEIDDLCCLTVTVDKGHWLAFGGGFSTRSIVTK